MIRAGNILITTILLLVFTSNIFAKTKPENEPPAFKYLYSYLASSGTDLKETETLIALTKDYESLLKFFKKRQQKIKSPEHFIELVFTKVQEAFIHRYQQYAGMSSIFSDYTFDCVTATALYVSYLSDLVIDFEIWETNYHTYIKVQADGNLILLETTDPLEGLKTGDEITTLETRYLEDNKEGC